jgi:hypothetical protein
VQFINSEKKEMQEKANAIAADDDDDAIKREHCLSTASRVFTHRQPMALNEIKINFLLFLRGERVEEK